MFTNCSKCSTLVGNVANEETMWEDRGLWDISIASSQFGCKPKSALKIKN